MQNTKYFIKSLIISFISLLVLSLVITLLSYFNLLNYSYTKFLLRSTTYISIFIGSFIFGKKIKNKIILEGIKFSLLFVILFIVLNGFSWINLLYYVSFIFCSIFGVFVSSNTKRND